MPFPYFGGFSLLGLLCRAAEMVGAPTRPPSANSADTFLACSFMASLLFAQICLFCYLIVLPQVQLMEYL
jgi:hypothetical protein